jgi:hypothetical protein
VPTMFRVSVSFKSVHALTLLKAVFDLRNTQRTVC